MKIKLAKDGLYIPRKLIKKDRDPDGFPRYGAYVEKKNKKLKIHLVEQSRWFFNYLIRTDGRLRIRKHWFKELSKKRRWDVKRVGSKIIID